MSDRHAPSSTQYLNITAVRPRLPLVYSICPGPDLWVALQVERNPAHPFPESLRLVSCWIQLA